MILAVPFGETLLVSANLVIMLMDTYHVCQWKMAYDTETDSYMTEDELRKLNKARKRAINKSKSDEQAAKRLVWVNNQKLARQPVGTPVGNKQRMQEFKDALLKEENGSRVIKKVIEIAMNDEHPGQVQALKLCMDRMLPASLFEEKKDGARTAIHITIGRVGEKQIGEVIENE